MPSQLTSARSPWTRAWIDSKPTYGARTKNWTATSFCARCSAAPEKTLEPVKRQTMIALAKPSIAESSPKPISATEPASTPARIATAPSAVMYMRLAHDSSRTRPASRA